MRKFIVMTVAVMLCGALSAQQSIKSNEVGPFHAIQLTGNISAELIVSDKNAVEINLFDTNISKLRWEVAGEVLSVVLRPEGMKGTGRADVKIFCKAVDDISVSGGELSSKDVIKSMLFTLKVTSGANVTLAFDCKDMEIDATGNSAVMLEGVSKYLKLRASEKSRLDARKLEAVAVRADAFSGGEIYLYAAERLEAYAKTGSSIFYKGDPTILRVPTSKFMGLGASVNNIGK